MATTEKITAVPDAWTPASQGEGNVAIQLIGFGQISVHLSDEAPDMAASGVTIGKTTDATPREFSLSGIDGSNIYVRALNGRSVDIVVMKY